MRKEVMARRGGQKWRSLKFIERLIKIDEETEKLAVTQVDLK